MFMRTYRATALACHEEMGRRGQEPDAPRVATLWVHIQICFPLLLLASHLGEYGGPWPLAVPATEIHPDQLRKPLRAHSVSFATA
ncbi:hypothetical protein SAMN05216274_12341 [Cryobacterium levicorallinum]|uniref:Uncharacterized protein n=1 Tax=Cryobacterium levicorallinum TaxID=995038 RepID=A0ABY1EI80_9MICO|nr:hypothetical protein SAMN05216274_12341 [Cryobacterium levicorallinum]